MRPSFKTISKREHIFGSLPLFKPESLDTESDSLPVHSNYINVVLRRKVSHDPTFGVYQDDIDGSFKIGRSSFKYNNTHVFVDGKLITQRQVCGNYKSKPDRNLVSVQDKHINKYPYSLMLIELITVSQLRTKPLMVLNIHGLFSNSSLSQRNALGIVTIMSLGKAYYDRKHAAGYGSVVKVVNASKLKKRDVEECLSDHNTYNLHKTVRKRFPGNAYTVTNIDLGNGSRRFKFHFEIK